MNYRNMAIAAKRAKSFGLGASGPFSPLRSNAKGAAIGSSNYCMMLDACEEESKQRYLGDLCIFDAWAAQINVHCDSANVAESEDILLSLDCFKSRLWLNPLPLNQRIEDAT